MREKDTTKKEIADFCETVYRDESLSPKQITDRLGSMIKRHLKNSSVGIKSDRVRVGQHSEVHYQLTNISDKLKGDAKKRAEVKEAHRISNKLREWKDAIMALDMPHHLIEKHLEKATKNLEEYIPDFAKLMNPQMDISTLRDNWKIIYKNERRGKNRAAVVKALQDIRIEHHAYYLIQPIYVWVRKIGTSMDRDKRDSNVMNQVQVNPEFAISTAEKLLSTSLEVKEANKFDLALGLAIATGRRRTEIFKTAVFDVIDTTPDNHVMFSGQLKTHDRELFDDVKPYAIPCLIDRDLVMQGLALLRKIQKDDHVTYLDQRGNEVTHGVLELPLSDQYHTNAVGRFYSHSANQRIRAIFDNPRIEFRHSRDMYSEIGYEKFKNKGEGRSAYRTRVYGHAKGQSETGRSYEKFEITTEVEKASFMVAGEEKVSASQNQPVVDALTKMTPKIEAWKRSPNAIRIHSWLIEQLSQGLPVDNITAHFIRKHIMLPDVQQLNLRSIQTYLSDKWINWEEIKGLVTDKPIQDDIDNDIDNEIDMIESVDDDDQDEPEEEVKKPTEPAPLKPKMKGHKDDDGAWLVDVEIKDESWQINVGKEPKNVMEAFRLAWNEFEFRRTLPENPPAPLVTKDAGMWHSRIMIKGQAICEVWTPSKKASKESTLILYRELVIRVSDGE
ncbi:hypothetical protein HC752_21520 [Vibrio sp. S9_S30]|uniref:protelomerase family protein n=1 Tax=Vibrio sp. S9_S30 TaxID=2720226 RepID=UPI001681B077|nr:protelomerase family protein [Vibrio sp. S9_S30]MBD1559526.1 hypothetical protein [Vibrio sp. S9_S30]